MSINVCLNQNALKVKSGTIDVAFQLILTCKVSYCLQAPAINKCALLCVPSEDVKNNILAKIERSDLFKK